MKGACVAGGMHGRGMHGGGHVWQGVFACRRDDHVMNDVHMLSHEGLLIAHLVPSDWTTS